MIEVIGSEVMLVVTDDAYFEGYYSLLDSDNIVHWQRYPTQPVLLEKWQHLQPIARLHQFSHGFIRLEQQADALVLTDLRMGLEPGYNFSFLLPLTAERSWTGAIEQLPPQRDPAAFRWLYLRATAQTNLDLRQWLAAQQD